MNQAISCLLLRINIILGTRKKGPGLAPGPWCVVRDYRSPTMKSSLATANPILFSTLSGWRPVVKLFDSLGTKKLILLRGRVHIPGGDLAALLFGLAFAIFVLKVDLPLLATKEFTGCHPDKGCYTQTCGEGQCEHPAQKASGCGCQIDDHRIPQQHPKS